MNMRTWVMIPLLMVAGCGTANPPRIHHVVLFKLGDPGAVPEFIAESDAMLADIPGVQSYFSGTPLDTSRDAPVDLNFDVFFSFGFGSVEDYKAYLNHPRHVELITRWRPRLEWIRVHDAIEEE